MGRIVGPLQPLMFTLGPLQPLEFKLGPLQPLLALGSL